MPKLDLTITVSLILAFSSVISPIATTILNNHHQLKLKLLDLKEKRYTESVIYQREIFENYLRNAGKYAKSPNLDFTKSAEYGEYYFLAYMYAPSELQQQMKCLDSYIVDHDAKGISRMLPLVTSSISAHIVALQKG